MRPEVVSTAFAHRLEDSQTSRRPIRSHRHRVYDSGVDRVQLTSRWRPRVTPELGRHTRLSTAKIDRSGAGSSIGPVLPHAPDLI